MDELSCIRVFLEVARRGSFHGAAQGLGLSRSSVSKHIAWLENAFDVRLLNRTTKNVTITAEGQYLLNTAPSAIERFDHLRASIQGARTGISGTIRIGVPPTFGTRRFLPVIAEFTREYPDIQICLSLSASSNKDQIAKDALDINIVITPALEDSSFIALPLGEATQALVASPDYLRRCPPLRKPTDLVHCNCLINTLKSPSDIWRFDQNDEKHHIKVKGSLRSDIGGTLKAAAIMGLGISMHPYYMILEELECDLLRVVLPAYPPASLHVYAVYPSRTLMPSRVRKFVDFLAQWAKEPKPWTAKPTETGLLGRIDTNGAFRRDSRY